ncbi:AraC family transcriptional regulator [Pseudomonas vanderleydeniana]|uniref:Helix-turn-helix transcriptional regulator n=1 Tax=Pseudomonas vanderleydeniana TaxID=2745495 RepID=A0A9E6PKC6_9PSED|nr:helix-turn-helix transcriptional regulator [Pseudomonas vanderleydeniana]QXI27758.1 helix-turn-helix transcriptional regulator [Pseudomonas vanderleydeniana]
MQTLISDYQHGEVVGSHCHNEAQLVYATRGVMYVCTEQGSWAIPTGHALWVPAGVAHEIRMSGEVRMRTLLIDPALYPVAAVQCQVIQVSNLLRELILASAQGGSEERCYHLGALILLELQSARQVDLYIPAPRDARLRTLCTRFLDQPAQEWTLEQCGAQLNMSSRTFARLFQRELAMSFGEWRTRARLVLSQQSLAQGASILDVALEFGYQSASAFAAVFKRELGHTPRQYRMNEPAGCPV